MIFFKIKKLLKYGLEYFYYNSSYKSIGRRSRIIKPLRIIGKRFIEIGSNVIIMHHARIEAVYAYAGVTFYPVIKVGNGTDIQQRVHITCAESLVIGNNVSILPDVLITDINHPYTDISTPPSQCKLEHRSVSIGDETIIGMGARILPGVHIGKHCCIGTNAVVTKDIPDYCVAVGNPAVVIKQYDFDKHEWKKIGDTIKMYRGGVNKKVSSCTRKVA